MKKIVFTVTNDLSFDQRMERICSTLADNGYAVTLFGRACENSKPLNLRNFRQKRIPCYFQEGKLLYIEYNVKLLWKLLFVRTDIICSIDLDSILPGYIASTIRGKTLVYDAHEYFTEMEEIVSRPAIKAIWLTLEKFVMKRIVNAYTISEGYAKLFMTNYGKSFEVIRNAPRLESSAEQYVNEQKIVQYQGILNIGRGLEEAIKAVSSLDGFTLRIFGDGPHANYLKQMATDYQAEDKIQFMGMVEPEILREKTKEAWIGLTLFSNTGLHHQQSLANRFFDYFHADIPQIAMGYSEYVSFNKQHEVALLIPELTAMALRVALLQLEQDQDLYKRIQGNCHSAASENNWQAESKKLIAFYDQL